MSTKSKIVGGIGALFGAGALKALLTKGALVGAGTHTLITGTELGTVRAFPRTVPAIERGLETSAIATRTVGHADDARLPVSVDAVGAHSDDATHQESRSRKVIEKALDVATDLPLDQSSNGSDDDKNRNKKQPPIVRPIGRELTGSALMDVAKSPGYLQNLEERERIRRILGSGSPSTR